MTITTEINEAKNDLDHIVGEINRVLQVLTLDIDNAELVFEALDSARAKARKVRASL